MPNGLLYKWPAYASKLCHNSDDQIDTFVQPILLSFFLCLSISKTVSSILPYTSGIAATTGACHPNGAFTHYMLLKSLKTLILA